MMPASRMNATPQRLPLNNLPPKLPPNSAVAFLSFEVQARMIHIWACVTLNNNHLANPTLGQRRTRAALTTKQRSDFGYHSRGQ